MTIYQVPFADLGVKEGGPLQVEPVQSEFVVVPTKPTRVQYKAPGADRYRLSLSWIWILGAVF